ncbi:23S rRNA (adenine(2030)-N(6))-methyltransferase RlmJ, partial [Mesorhizobium sp. M0815]|uniref:23S rRNA (adenine(2030)-N(6))-methyltransferase RlmJ n=1 Tax=Mesorhizobium sp. M0815 TaxID=2957005 RepID=UPI00333D01D0
MNYRHAYHAGNFADVVKHAVLSRLIEYLKQKDKAFRVIDTHAGIGRYDLSSTEAQKTGEWQGGGGRGGGGGPPPPPPRGGGGGWLGRGG